MEEAVKASRKALAEYVCMEVWGVLKAAGAFAALSLAAFAVLGQGDYSRGAFYVAMAVYFKD